MIANRTGRTERTLGIQSVVAALKKAGLPYASGYSGGVRATGFWNGGEDPSAVTVILNARSPLGTTAWGSEELALTWVRALIRMCEDNPRMNLHFLREGARAEPSVVIADLTWEPPVGRALSEEEGTRYFTARLAKAKADYATKNVEELRKQLAHHEEEVKRLKGLPATAGAA